MDSFTDGSLLTNLNDGHETAGFIRDFLTLMGVCHTVVPEREPEDPNTIVYQASSPGNFFFINGLILKVCVR